YSRFEEILVDNGSTDDTAAICREFPEVRHVYFDQRKSSYAARNQGAREAKGEVLVFFDADQTAKPNCLSLLLAEYRAGDPYHIYCGRLADDPRIPLVLRKYLGLGESNNNIATACVALPRQLYDQLGGFKEHLLSGGDFEFFQRATQIGRVHHCQEVGGYHY